MRCFSSGVLEFSNTTIGSRFRIDIQCGLIQSRLKTRVCEIGIKRCRRLCSTTLKSDIDQRHKILESHTVSTDSVSSLER